MSAQLQETQNTAPTEKTPQQSFAEMRQIIDETRKEKAQMQQKIAKLEEMAEKASERKAAPAPVVDDEETNDPYVDNRTLNRKLQRMQEDFEKKMDQKAEEKAKTMIAGERRDAYLRQNSDFRKIMESDLVQKFAEKHPEVAESILAMPESFERQKLVYSNIKALGLHKEEEPKVPIQQQIDHRKKNYYYIPGQVGSAPYAAVADYSPASQKLAFQKMRALQGRPVS